VAWAYSVSAIGTIHHERGNGGCTDVVRNCVKRDFRLTRSMMGSYFRVDSDRPLFNRLQVACKRVV